MLLNLSNFFKLNMVFIEQLKQLREETGISMMECKKAIEEAGGDLARAKTILREKGKEIIKGKEERTTNNGLIASYIHSGAKIGVLVQLQCETDFVARNEVFQKLAHEICLQIAAARPIFIKNEDIPEELLENEKKIYQKQFQDSGKLEKIINQIIEGKLAKYKKEICLLEQSWVRDETKTIKDLIKEYIAKIGENIEIKRFVRYEI